jgi:Cdc6-like AAA superfamily ATPase
MPDIRLAQSSWDLIDTLKRVWNFRVNYAPIRLAIGRSLLSGDVPDFELRGDDGRAIDTQQIFSGGGTDYTPLFRALIVQRHGRALTDDEFLQLLKAHVDHGFALIRNDTNGFKSEDDYVDYLVELTRIGLEQRGQEAAPVIETTPAFSGLLNLQIGWNAGTDAPVGIEFNRQTNNYLAVTGKPGSGKTQFVKDLLAQIRLQSEYKVNFVFFDYAKGDVADDADFVEMTQAGVVRLPEESLPLNPFSRVNVNSETAVKVAAQEFADLIRDVEKRLGTVQAQLLYDAILKGFEATRGENPPFPDFEIINQEIEYDYTVNRRKLDTLTEIMRQLTDFKIFARRDNPQLWQNLTDTTVIVDLHGLTVLRELTVCLVLTALYRELMAMPDSTVTDGVREMRTIIVIDEAHHFLKDKKRNAILERLIREIRSKGASVFLMSQSPDDYDRDNFDFTELLEFIFLLQSNAGATKFLQNAFGLSSQEAKTLSSEVANLPTAEAVGKSYGANTREKVNRLRVRQFWREKGK